MIGRRTIIGLALMCTLALSALVAQGASASGNGQTIFECSASATTKEFSDAHCDTVGTGFGHVQFPTSSTAISLTNGGTKNSTTEPTIATLSVPLLHGVSNVDIECTNVAGTGTALNTAGPPMKGSGSGTISFNDGTGVLCKTNQAGCEGPTATVGAKVATVSAKAESVEGTTLKEKEGETEVSGGHGLKFEPVSGNFTTITFEGTCGLHAFGAIPVAGSTIATAGGKREGTGATAWFIPGPMNSLTVGGSAAQLEGKATLKRTSNGNALTLTTS